MARVGVGLGLGMGEDVRDEVSRGRCPGAWRQMSEHGRQQVVSATCDGRGGGVRQCFSGWQTDTPARERAGMMRVGAVVLPLMTAPC